MRIQYISKIDRSAMLSDFAKVFINAGHEFFFTHIEKNDILIDYEILNPDILLVHHNRGILSKDIWKQMQCYKVWWVNDERIPPDQWRKDLADVFDLFLVASMDSVKIMRNLGTHAEYLIMGFDKKPVRKIERDIDICFLGQNSGNVFPLSRFRYEMITRLRNEKYNFVLGGDGWSSKIKKLGKGNYFRSKIGLSIGHQDYKYVYSNRMIEIMAHGAMCLSYRTSKLEHIFPEDEVCVYFEDYSEMIEKIDYYLAHDEKRKEIAERGRLFVESRFTWKHKACDIMNFLSQKL